jgi:undecaprenyl-diphosphatase
MDHEAFRWVVHHRVSWLDPFFEGATYLGIGGWLWLFLAALLALATRRNVLRTVLLTAAAVWFADAVAWILKAAVGRPRPFVTLHDIHLLAGRPVSTSFPSSHATTAFAGATFLSYRFPRAAAPLFAVAAVIAFSRVYVGAHYPADVLAGALLGTVIALVVVVASRSARVATALSAVERRLRGLTARRG